MNVYCERNQIGLDHRPRGRRVSGYPADPNRDANACGSWPLVSTATRRTRAHLGGRGVSVLMAPAGAWARARVRLACWRSGEGQPAAGAGAIALALLAAHRERAAEVLHDPVQRRHAHAAPRRRARARLGGESTAEDELDPPRPSHADVGAQRDRDTNRWRRPGRVSGRRARPPSPREDRDRWASQRAPGTPRSRPAAGPRRARRP